MSIKSFNPNRIRDKFPILNKKINNNQLVYFDNAATTQKPIQVIESINKYYSEYNANIHRGIPGGDGEHIAATNIKKWRPVRSPKL